MRKIGVYTNISKDPDLEVTRRIISCLEQNSVEPILSEAVAEKLNMTGYSLTEFVRQSEIIISVGGDGTVLRIAVDAMFNSKPILSVNLGRLGFLSEVEVCDTDKAITRLVNGDYFTENRMMLRAFDGNIEGYALNEIALQRYHNTSMIRFSLSIDGNEVDRFAADGVIISSPTGSTAYSLSAGGPILSPNVDAMVVTPICAHTLHAKPIVASADEVITIKQISGKGCLVADGYNEMPVTHEFNICKAPNGVNFIRFEKRNFYSLLKNKFAEWNQF